MAFLFGRNKQRGGQDLCRQTRDSLLRLEGGNLDTNAQRRTEEELARNISQMKLVLQGTADADANPDQQYQLINHLIAEDVLLPLANNMRRIPFEARKDAQLIFSSIFRFQLPNQNVPYALNYIAEVRPEIIPAMCLGYDNKASALPCGTVIREALRYEAVAALILYDEPMPEGQTFRLRDVDSNQPSSGNGVFWKFFEWIDRGAFEVSTDAFSTFKEIFTRQKKITSHFLRVNMTLFTTRFNTSLIQSTSYVTKRQSLSLLSTLLLERTNFTLMTSYISSPDNLKLIMTQLRDDRRMVNFEAFHVFKIFVANPAKSVPVQRILINNRQKLLQFLPTFLEDRNEDVQLADEKAYLISMIQKLPEQPTAAVPVQQNGVTA